MDRLRRSLREAPVVERDGYHYFVHPVSDGIPSVDPALLREIAVEIARVASTDVDRIVTPAAMGIHLSTAVSLMTDLPVSVVRKREYGLDGEVSLRQRTGYSEADMFINGVAAGERVLVIDDVLSTGGTLAAVLETLDDMDVEVADAVAVIRKVDGGERIAEADHEVTSLVDVEVVDGEVVIRQ